MLLILDERPTHGYELLRQLESLGFIKDQRGLYRALHDFEADGLVRVRLTDSEHGPLRHEYRLTRRGRTHLDSVARDVAETADVLQEFLRRHASVVGQRHKGVRRLGAVVRKGTSPVKASRVPAAAAAARLPAPVAPARLRLTST